MYTIPSRFSEESEGLAKQKDCELVSKWEQSMINHMYWCVVSTPNGDGDMMVAKWLSLENHIHNKHSGHGKLFRSCAHGRLVGRTRNKKWFERCDNVCVCTRFYNNKHYLHWRMLNSAKTLPDSPVYQSSSLESFHGVIIHFAPKSTAFSYQVMQCR